MAKVALVTGGSSGIGAAFARRLASEGYDLVLVARHRDRLEQVAGELHDRYGTNVELITADLSEEEGLLAVEARLRSSEKPVDFLVNNAGFGIRGSFLDIPISEYEGMLAVNVGAVLRLTHAALTPMVERGSGDILNVSSVACYFPNFRPSTVYAATKAFVTAFSEGLQSNLGEQGVHISALCPGFVRTEFHSRAGISMKKMPALLWLDSDDVVRVALRDHRAGKVVSIPGAQYKLAVTATRIIPAGVSRPVIRLVSKLTHSRDEKNS